MKPADTKIYLASKSPRRRELLRQIGVEFELLLLRGESPRGPDVNEDALPDEAPDVYVARVTRDKAEYAAKTMLWRRLPMRPILAADTTVTIDGRILGKPANADEAFDMLKSLSGRTHEVLTSIALWHDENVWQATQVSKVTFAKVSDDMLRAYCATPEPFDKAGAYGVQGLAAVFIEHIAGSYTGIMGLPLFETAQLLRNVGVQVP
ncbi:septum formation inhibitor Maf [Oxalobacteraceae bacterium OM1]|nr:septum formation inhibitor Maf [Oxalobacteraceae bacterium OM1]